MTLKEKALYISILFFLLTLYFPYWPILGILGTASVIISGLAFSSFKEKWNIFKERKHLWWMMLFFLMVVISVFLSDNFSKGLRYLDPRLPLFFFPIAIGTLNLQKGFRDKILLGFALITVCIGLLCFGYGLQRSQFFQQPEFMYNDALTKILLQQSIYISLLVNLSIFILSYHILFKQIKYKGLLILCVLFLFGFSYLLASRIMMAILYLSVVGFCFYYIIQKKKYLEGVTLLMGLLIGVFLIFKFFPNTFNRFKELTHTEFKYESMGQESHYNMAVTEDQWNGANFRLAAWRCGWKLFKEQPVLGVGIGDKKDRLYEVYEERNFQFAIKTEKNVHSNYLDVLYSMGIVGFVLFMIAWVIVPLVLTIKNRDGLGMLIVLTFAAAWLTEIYLDRSLGGMLTGFFIPFVLTDKRQKERQP